MADSRNVLQVVVMTVATPTGRLSFSEITHYSSKYRITKIDLRGWCLL